MFSVSDLIPPLAEYSYQWIFFFCIMAIALVYILYRLYSSISATPKTVSFDVMEPQDLQDSLTPEPAEENTIKAANDVESSVLTSVDEIDNGLLIPSPAIDEDDNVSDSPSQTPELAAVEEDQGHTAWQGEPSSDIEQETPPEADNEVEHPSEPQTDDVSKQPKKRKSRSKKIPV